MDYLPLYGTAALVGLTHTLIGPDHYIPFIAMSRARGWSMRRTALLTIVCGVGHVLSSILIGAIGIGLGAAALRLVGLESARGNLAGWLLLAFGLAYMAWAIKRYSKRCVPAGGDAQPEGDASHGRANPVSLTPWILFTIFIFGPCEPLIPVLMVPAAQGGVFDVLMVSLVFAVATIGTMVGMVLAGLKGMELLPMTPFRRHGHLLAGLAVTLCGLAVALGL